MNRMETEELPLIQEKKSEISQKQVAQEPGAKEPHQEEERKPLGMVVVYGVIFFGMVIGSLTVPLLKIVTEMGVSGSVMTFYRMGIVSLSLAPIVFFTPKYRKELKHGFSGARTGIGLAVLGICKFLSIYLASFGIKYLSTLVWNTTLNLQPVYVIILAYVMLRERIRARSYFGVFLCLAGVLVVGSSALVQVLGSGSASSTIIGFTLGLVCGLAGAVYLVVSRILRSGVSLPTLMFVLFTIAALLDLAICLVEGESLLVSLPALGLLVFLALFCTLLSQGIPVWAVKYVSPATYSLIGLMGIGLSAVAAYFLNGEIPTLNMVIGVIILMIGLAFYILSEQEKGKEKR